MSCFKEEDSPQRAQGARRKNKRVSLILSLSSLCALCVLCGEIPLHSQEKVNGPRRVTDQRDFLQHLQWSPDGKRFLVTRIHGGKMGLWTVDVDGTNWKRLLPADAQPHFDGHWSPDGKKIVFVYDILQGTDGKLQIDTMNADGSDRKTLVPHKAF